VELPNKLEKTFRHNQMELPSLVKFLITKERPRAPTSVHGL
jgi:hypothetical protein